MKRLILLSLVLCASLFGAIAQESEPESNGYLVDLIQDQLSTESRQIRLRGIDGLLASNAQVAEITIADPEGVWLTIKDARIIWSRLALFSGRLQIERLEAAEISMPRLPIPEEALPTAEATPLSIPTLPLSVEIDALSVPALSLGEPILGEAASFAFDGQIALIDGGLDAILQLDRTDGPGGQFAVTASYVPETTDVAIDLDFQEPGTGIVSRLIGLPGAPDLALNVTGSGPVNDLDVDLRLTTDGAERIAGNVALFDAPDGIGFDADLGGQLDFFLPGAAAIFFSGDSRITARGTRPEAGGFQLDAMDLRTGDLTLNGSVEINPEGALRRAALTGRLGNGISPVRLPAEGATLQDAELDIRFGERADDLWGGEIKASGLMIGDLEIGSTLLELDGTAPGLNAGAIQALTATLTGRMKDLASTDPNLASVLSRAIALDVDLDWTAGQPGVRLTRADITGGGIDIAANGVLEGLAFDGAMSLNVDDLERFARLAGRDLGGSGDFTVTGSVAPTTGGFDLTLDGTAERLKLGIDALDPLIQGQTRITGDITRDTNGIRTRNLSLRNPQIRFSSDGGLASKRADISFDAWLSDIGLIVPDASGTVTFSGEAKGEGDIGILSRFAISDGSLLDRPLTGLAGGLTGKLTENGFDGRLITRGALGEEPLSLTGNLSANAETQELERLLLRVGQTRISGDMARDPDGFLTGALRAASNDISDFAALFLQEAAGRIDANLTLAKDSLGQRVEVSANAADVATSSVALETLDIDAVVYDAFGVPSVIGTLDLGNLNAAGVTLTNGTVDARVNGETTDFDLDAALDNGTTLDLGAALTREETGFTLGLNLLQLSKETPLATLAAPTEIQITPERVNLEELRLLVQGGAVTVGGQLDDRMDFNLDIDKVPLSVANALVEGLGAVGTLSGKAGITGTMDNPAVAVDLRASGVGSAALRAAQLPPMDLFVFGDGDMENGLGINARLDGPQNFNATVAGTVPSTPSGDLSLQGTVDRFPLILINPLIGRPGLNGRVDGTFSAAGKMTLPEINFDLDARGLAADATRQNSIPALNATVKGSFLGDRVVLERTRITGPDGIDFSGRGTIPLRLEGLDAEIEGTLPVTVANVILARSGLTASGTAQIALTARGALTAPDLAGTLRIREGTFIAPVINLRLGQLSGDATFSGKRLTFSKLDGRNSGGGWVRTKGWIDIDPPADFPADIDIDVGTLRYTDASFLTMRLSSDLNLSGPLGARPKLTGDIDIDKAEIAIPDISGGSGAVEGFSLQVGHRNPPREVSMTLNRAGIEERRNADKGEAWDIDLDVTLNAPQRIFVRGRGLDAELGGQIEIGGSGAAAAPVGQLNLVRGRMNVLGQRLDLTDGEIAFTGDLNPEMSLRAQTAADEVTATIALTGPVIEPTLELSSTPALPNDEILARIIFRRELGALSALQVAQLAAAAAELAGQSNGSIFEQVRRATGLDDFDFQTADDGSTSLRVGAYLRDNVYSSIEADDRGNSRVSVNLDINRQLKVRGSLDSEGDTSLGVFFERDY